MLTPEDLQAIKVIIKEENAILKKEIRAEIKAESRRLEKRINKKIDTLIEYFETRLTRHHERLDRIEYHLGIYQSTPEQLKLHDAPQK